MASLSPLRPCPVSDGAAMSQPLVTIGIPTYKRPELLRRALACVVKQDYRNIELIVADNDTPGTLVTEIVESFRLKIDNLLFIRHRENIGAYANFFALLDAAHGEYFMWLADDDEISNNYISGLVNLLEGNLDASSAAGHWITVMDEGTTWPRSTSSFPERSPLARVLRFIWRTDDAFFYALHRTSVIRKASFPGYWWPNKGMLFNWGYVFLLDMVLQGRVLLADDSSVQFVNHDCSAKFYVTRRSAVIEIFQFCVRRLNVHWLYLQKATAAIGVWALPVIFLVSLAAILREFGSFFASIGLTKLRRLWSVLSGG
jgi:glycosyltransferase involved in cell wall biosynthesis